MTTFVLQYLGYVPYEDFMASHNNATGQIEVEWYIQNPPTQAEIDAAVLPATKASRLTDIRAEAKTRIEALYPQWRQLDAALGLLPDTYVEQMRADIAAIIQASNTAEDAVDAATTIEAVNAVEVVWP